MSATSPSTASPASHAGATSPGQPPHPNRIVRKRNRIPLSCGPCRARKLKCNRLHPCDNCTRRNDTPACAYASTAVAGGRRKTAAASASAAGADDMQARIDRLENLVLSLMNGKSPGGAASEEGGSARGTGEVTPASSSAGGVDTVDEDDDDGEDSVDEMSNSLGVMKVQGGKSLYRGSSHWAAILGEIGGVKKMMMETKKKFETELAAAKGGCQDRMDRMRAGEFQSLATSGFASLNTPSKEELLAMLPPKEEADGYLQAYFASFDGLFHVIHRLDFIAQYNAFWADPHAPSPCFLSLVFSILSIGSRILHPNSSEHLKLRCAAEHSLLLGHYLRKPHEITAVQSLILLNSFAPYRPHTDALWISLGTTIRLALSMGLHRDPSSFPDIPPAEAELRRRLWSILCSIDIFTSCQISLPTIIKPSESDTLPPRNLHDEDLKLHTTDPLPASRPDSELTATSFMLHKRRLASIHAEIAASTTTVGAPRPPYTEILRLEKLLDDAHAALPPALRHLPFPAQARDDAWLIAQRFSLAVLHLRGLVMLHRPFASRSSKNPRYLYSRERCIAAAVALLDRQHELHAAIAAGLDRCAWLAQLCGGQDFLHAAMVVGLHLFVTGKEAAERGEDGKRERRRLLGILRRYRELVVAGLGEEERDERCVMNKVEIAIGAVLEKLERDEAEREAAEAGGGEGAVDGGEGAGGAPEQGVVLPPVAAWQEVALGSEDVGMAEGGLGLDVRELDEWDNFMKGMDLEADMAPFWGGEARSGMGAGW